MRRVIFSLIICIMMVVLCSCSKSASESTAEKEKPIPEFTALTEVVDGQKDIYLITKVVDSNYWDIVEEGAKAAGEKYGCNIYFSGTNNEMDWKNQIILLDKAVNAGADAIVFAPDDSISLAPKLEDIYSKKIPIVLVDTIVNTDSFDICYMTDNLEAGNKAAEEMLNRLEAQGVDKDEKIKIGILVGTAQSQTINERLAGFYQYWTDNAPENWEIISDILNCNGDMDLGKQLVDDLLKRGSDLRGLFATNNGPTKVLAKSVVEKGAKDIVVVGFDYSDEIKTMIESPDYHASTILQRQFYMSYKGVKTALDLLDGAKLDVKYENTGVIKVNHENINDSDVQAIIEGKNEEENQK